METYWLMSSKSTYATKFDRDPFRTNEDERSGLNFQQTSMFENNAQPVFHRQSSPDDHPTSVRRGSPVFEKCPFSGAQGQFD